VSPVQEGIWVGAWRLLIAQASADLFAGAMLLLLPQLILEALVLAVGILVILFAFN